MDLITDRIPGPIVDLAASGRAVPGGAADRGPRDEHAAADSLAELLLALECDPMRHFRLHPLAVRGHGDPAASIVVAVEIGGRRWALSEAETRLAARCLRDERAFRGASVLAAAFETTLAHARDAASLLGDGRRPFGTSRPDVADLLGPASPRRVEKAEPSDRGPLA